MQYNFDEIIDRSHTFAVKVDNLPHGCPKDALPLWVADMDLPCAQPIIDALHERIDRRIFGYTEYSSAECKQSVVSWHRRRFDWQIAEDNIFFSPGVVPALAFLLEALSSEGEGIIIQPPVYHPFALKIQNTGRRVLHSPLIKDEEHCTYRMDYADLERQFARPDTAGMILCSPHNPVGRVWSEQELRQLIEIAARYGKWIISDEIHADLTRFGVRHTPLLKIAGSYADHIAACTSPSKTFNLAGAQLSNIIIPNQDWQRKWKQITEARYSVSMASPFALTALIAAYTHGEDWLEQARRYIDANIAYAADFLRAHLPKTVVYNTEGTYLMWIDFSAYCAAYRIDEKGLEKLMQQKARIAFDEGYIFGAEGACFERLNAACPRSVLEECMRRLLHVFT